MKPAPPVTRILIAVSGRLDGSKECDSRKGGSHGDCLVGQRGASGSRARRGARDLRQGDGLRSRARSISRTSTRSVSALRAARPAVVVNAAAFTDVDGAERDEAAATRVNGDAVAALGEECRRLRAGLVHYSTDFVFDGHGVATLPGGRSDRRRSARTAARSWPASRRSRASGAPAIVLRTAWVYSPRRRSFVALDPAARARARDAPHRLGSGGQPDLRRRPRAAPRRCSSTACARIRSRPSTRRAASITWPGGGVATRFELAHGDHRERPQRQRAPRASAWSRCRRPTIRCPAPRPAFAPLDCEKMQRGSASPFRRGGRRCRGRCASSARSRRPHGTRRARPAVVARAMAPAEYRTASKIAPNAGRFAGTASAVQARVNRLRGRAS